MERRSTYTITATPEEIERARVAAGLSPHTPRSAVIRYVLAKFSGGDVEAALDHTAGRGAASYRARKAAQAS